jgi:hypothetical protein
LSDQRIIDDVPRMIDAKFLIPLPGEMRKALLERLGVFTEDGATLCKGWLEEDPFVSEKRHDLGIRRDRLADAKVAIRRLKMK